ncbi:glycosyltransferase [Spirilliplanes yamanashiensis]|uniref:Glycosyl transferase n=1 Tax=Spirilliplanes yamanashiensis TaxID=42233 RepID=A0A8J3Y604_9ACTN|nr:glycosyltransferase [Spirilliplanes yamanashiensis]MDP9814837.1 glycosyltransferase involved in cell wall biosynthesis [Spirilliplanes yamanashiensis]GIJ02491.1 glycosyl transferase [Spirilliplanes yamanashiensis]
MKVVVAHNRYRTGQPSGENVIVDAEMAQLRAAGVEVIPFLRESDAIATMSKGEKALLPISPIWNRSAQQDLARVIGEHRPDLLHLHNPYPLLSPWVVRTAHAHGVPVVQTVHNYRQVCSSGLYFRDGHVCHDCRDKAFGLPAIRHRCYRDSALQSALMATTLAVHRPTWKSVDRYVALTDGIAWHLRDYGIPRERITVKPNAIDDPGEPAPPGDGFLYFARLSPEKGVGLLLDAWRRHPDGALGTLRVAGDGELRPLVEAAATERSDVEYLGILDRAGIQAALRATAVVVAVPTWHDVLPTVVIEAFAAGRPVLGTAMGGIPYLIGHSGGWTVEPTADAVAAALPAARAGAAAAAPAARARYLDTFHPDVVTRQLIDIYADSYASHR